MVEQVKLHGRVGISDSALGSDPKARAEAEASFKAAAAETAPSAVPGESMVVTGSPASLMEATIDVESWASPMITPDFGAEGSARARPDQALGEAMDPAD